LAAAGGAAARRRLGRDAHRPLHRAAGAEAHARSSPGVGRPRRARLRWRGLAAALLAGLAALWLGGLVWFAQRIPTEVADSETRTDAIVVLTGGSLRVQSGLALLAAGMAKKLFISGVYRSTDVAALLRVSRQSPAHVACCIALGHAADNTYGNALETAQWMRKEGFHSLRLVTASYHMPRSLLEFSRAMPDLRIIPNPVFPPGVPLSWWTSPRGLVLVVGEYQKYLLALARPLVMPEGAAEAGP
jgi:uncharacterized SAM-binding protein YcdF (DUF218 family)